MDISGEAKSLVSILLFGAETFKGTTPGGNLGNDLEQLWFFVFKEYFLVL